MKDESLKTLCHALQAVFGMLKPKLNPLSFVLLIGKQHQGKSTLLKHSNLTLYPILGLDLSLYYHDDGVILELSESWLIHQHVPVSHLIKQLNRIHPAVEVTGMILCIDVQTFFPVDHEEAKDALTTHVQWLRRCMDGLNAAVQVSVFLTKCDGLAGFTPFFQSDHPVDGGKPLGFSIHSRLNPQLVLRHFRSQFDKLVDGLGRQVLPKLHAVRSSTLRTQIREFPLQLASIRLPLQSLVECLVKSGIHLQGIYWMSASSFADPVDRLYHKFADDYGLMVVSNQASVRPHPAYFVSGACKQVLEQNKKIRPQWPKKTKIALSALVTTFVVLITDIGYQHIKTSGLLRETGQELKAYELLIQSQKPTAATYHLSQALRSLASIPIPMQHLAGVKKLETVLESQTHQTLEHRFLPELLSTLKAQMRSPQSSPTEQYEALKAYLQLTNPSHFSRENIQAWFNAYWAKHPPTSPEKAKSLLQEVLAQPIKQVSVDEQLIRDIRNHLNALPPGYFYYGLIKKENPAAKTPLQISGFALAYHELPVAYTKQAFHSEIKRLSVASKRFLAERWVLEHPDITSLKSELIQAYCAEYVTWWKQLIKQSHLLPIQDFQQAQHLANELNQAKSFEKLITLVQTNTSASQGLDASIFNDQVASQFTTLQFLSPGAINELNQTVREIVSFLATLSIVHDDGQTAFSFAKARFQGDTFSDSLSLLYQRAHSLPQPVSEWVQGLADSVWSMLIQQARLYLNAQWKKQVYEPYHLHLAKRYPFDSVQTEEVSLDEFDQFFAPQGVLSNFVQNYIQPFIDVSQAQWKPKNRDGLMMPISEEMMNELIRANVISNMFYPNGVAHGQIQFSLEKLNLDPVVARLSLTIGHTLLEDDQSSHEVREFQWPAQDATLKLDSIEGGHFNLSESGLWAFFKILQKVNVIVDPNDSSTLQILFDINGNAGRYVLKTKNQINPFSPGILEGFNLKSTIV